VELVIALIVSYLIGSVPTAYVFGKLYKGIDIREHGSGNVGATNAIRVLGKVPGFTVLLIDICKGVLPLTLVGNIFSLETAFSRVMLGLAVVAGHNWTIFLNFKGGKGIATSLGVLIGLALQFPELRVVLYICLLSWLIAFLACGYVSLASILAATLMPVVMVVTGQPFEIVLLGVIFCIFVVVRHQPNIKRLLSGKESRVNLPFHKKT